MWDTTPASLRRVEHISASRHPQNRPHSPGDVPYSDDQRMNPRHHQISPFPIRVVASHRPRTPDPKDRLVQRLEKRDRQDDARDAVGRRYRLQALVIHHLRDRHDATGPVYHFRVRADDISHPRQNTHTHTPCHTTSILLCPPSAPSRGPF